MDPNADYFALFQLPRQFEIDAATLTERYHALQAEVHPDKHASASDQQRLLAVQTSTRVNDAYQCLKSPLLRAAYLLELAGHGCDFSNYTLSDGDFLMQQMQLRETLAEAETPAAVEAFIEQAEAMQAEGQADFLRKYQQQDFDQARDAVSRLHFLFKLQSDGEARLEELEWH